VQADLAKSRREVERLRQINGGLIGQVKEERIATAGHATEKQKLTKQVLQLELQTEQSIISTDDLQSKIDTLAAENAKLVSRLHD